jgi:phosphohistidine phosphatase
MRAAHQPGHTLIVLRHAKAATPLGLADADRSLTGRGRRNAAEAGRELAAMGAIPDLVLCSPARRTRETWDELSGSLPAKPAVDYDGRIYGADPELLLDVVREVGDEVGTLLLVGHNPSVFELMLTLTDGEPPAAGFPTSAFAVVTLPVGWLDAGPGSGRLTTLWTPRR